MHVFLTFKVENIKIIDEMHYEEYKKVWAPT